MQKLKILAAILEELENELRRFKDANKEGKREGDPYTLPTSMTGRIQQVL